MATSLASSLIPFPKLTFSSSNKISHSFPFGSSTSTSKCTTTVPTTITVCRNALDSEIRESSSTATATAIFPDLQKQRSSLTKNKNDIKQTDGDRRLSDIWRELLGKNNWDGLLDPIDPLLRSELIRYGERAQACYDGFVFDTFSKYYGTCKYMAPSFFESLELTDHGYTMSRYLIATANINFPNFFPKSPRKDDNWSPNANWMGYVAVSDDETSAILGRRDISIAWRGTVTNLEWVADLLDFLKPVTEHKIPSPDPKVKAESGFLELYTDKDEKCRFCKYSAREQVLSEVRRLVEKHSGEELSITITGHSLGAALAVLSAYDIAETGLNKTADGRTVPVAAFTFAGPRVGNLKFKERVEELGVKVLRVVNVHDVVPKSPGFFFNEHVAPFLMKWGESLPWSYSHVGVELALDHKNSPYLKEETDVANAHNLEAQLHLLDGYHGKGKKFELSTGRDPALVNKSSNFLKDEFLIPPCWKQDENKGMVRNEDGFWTQPERPKLDDHEHPQHTDHHLKQLGLLSDLLKTKSSQ